MDQTTIETYYLALDREIQERWELRYHEHIGQSPLAHGRPTQDFLFFIVNYNLFRGKI